MTGVLPAKTLQRRKFTFLMPRDPRAPGSGWYEYNFHVKSAPQCLVCRTIAELASDFGVRLNQIVNWKKAAVGRGGEKMFAAGVSADGTTGEVDADVLYGQIG